MARIPIIMPKMSMTMTEGEVSTWFVKIGDRVNEGDVIVEVMTDKVDMEVESTQAGTLVEITVEEGMVTVGDPIGYLEGEESGFGDLLGGDESPTEDPAPRPAAGQAADTDGAPDVGGDVPADPPVPDARETSPSDSGPESGGSDADNDDADDSDATRAASVDLPPDPPAPSDTNTPATVPAHESEPNEAPRQIAAVPRARGLAREHGLDLAQISGSGPGGLVMVSDVEATITASQYNSSSTSAAKSEEPAGTGVPAPAGPASTTGPADPSGAGATMRERKPTRDRAAVIRAMVARKMAESASVPQFTVWRDIVLDQANGRRQGLSWTTVLLRAYAAALREVPELLCRWENDAAIPSGPPSVALAVATPGGLMVPVFPEPDAAAPRELDAEIKRVVAVAQQGRLDPAYLGVANGSLSNLGGLGADRFQALVTPPQASVMALGSIKQRPVPVPGGVGLALTVTAGITVDHRVADGAHAATLLERFAAHIG